MNKEISPAKKVRVALMSYSMDNRLAMGTAVYTRHLVDKLVNQLDPNFEWTLVHYKKNDNPLYAKAHEIIMPKVSLPFGSQMVSQLLFYFKFRKEKFDVIHWFQPRLYPGYWLAPAKKIVVTAHGSGMVGWKKAKFDLSKSMFNFIFTYLNRWIDFVIAGSEDGRRQIIIDYRIDESRVAVTYYGPGVDVKTLDKNDSLSFIKNIYGINEKFILTVGRLQPHKNIDSLVKAYIELRSKNKIVEHLVVIARPSEGAQETYNLASQSDYVNEIHFIDYVTDDHLNFFYSAAELFVFPSLNEGFGLPVVEAMKAGCPVIVSDMTSLPEIVGDAGLVIDTRDPKKIAQAIALLINNYKMREEYSKRGLERSAMFNWESTAEQTKKIYLNLK